MSNTSMPANFLNRTALPSITGLPASAPILPRPSTAVPLEITADQVAARRVVIGGVRISDDGLAGRRDTRRIGERQIALRGHALGRLDRELSRLRQPMVIERRPAEVVVHRQPTLNRSITRMSEQTRACNGCQLPLDRVWSLATYGRRRRARRSWTTASRCPSRNGFCSTGVSAYAGSAPAVP